RRGELGRSNADRKRAERTAGHRVAVGADDEVALLHEPALRRYLMADAVAHIQYGRAMSVSEVSYLGVKAARRRRVRRRVVVEREEHARRIEQPVALHAAEVIDRHWRRRVGAEHQIDGAVDDVPCGCVDARLGRQDLFADRPGARHESSGSVAGTSSTWVTSITSSFDSAAPSLRAIHVAPTKLLNVFTALRHMSSGRSTDATSAMPAA